MDFPDSALTREQRNQRVEEARHQSHELVGYVDSAVIGEMKITAQMIFG